VSAVIYATAEEWFDLVVVFEDPEGARNRYASPYTEAIAWHMADSVQHDPQWSKVFRVYSEQYGWLAGYRNQVPAGKGYDLLVWTHARNLP
jgi:hypothetical protein